MIHVSCNSPRLRLVDYWRTIDKWSALCADRGLSYNCRTEAGKLNAAW